jgi:hypothetical protein
MFNQIGFCLFLVLNLLCLLVKVLFLFLLGFANSANWTSTSNLSLNTRVHENRRVRAQEKALRYPVIAE